MGELSERLNVAFTYAWTQSRYQAHAQYEGNTVANVARHAASIWGRYRWNDRWSTGAGLYVQSRRFADQANTVTLPGYARFDLVQTWTKPLGGDRSVEVQLVIRNLLDKKYFVSSHLHVTQWITPGQGRNVSLLSTFRF